MRPDIDRDGRARARARRSRAAQVKRRRLVFLAGLIIIIAVIIAVVARSCGGEENSPGGSTESPGGAAGVGLVSASYTAELVGSDSVPPVDTRAHALLDLDYDAETGTMDYVLQLTYQISNPQSATICQGLPGEYGTTVYTLFAGPMKEGDFEGVLAQGSIVEDDLVGPLAGDTLADLIALIEDGEAYVSIGNERHPVDAIRGPIK